MQRVYKYVYTPAAENIGRVVLACAGCVEGRIITREQVGKVFGALREITILYIYVNNIFCLRE